VVACTFRPAGIFAVVPRFRTLVTARIDLATIVLAALVRVVQDRIGVADLLELVLSRLVPWV